MVPWAGSRGPGMGRFPKSQRGELRGPLWLGGASSGELRLLLGWGGGSGSRVAPEGRGGVRGWMCSRCRGTRVA